MRGISAGFAALGVLVGLFFLLAFIGGVIVYGLTHLFHLQDIVPLSFWQACGVSLIVGGPSLFAAGDS